MTKNKLEKLFSKSMHHFDWCIKLHNNPLAHQNTPADYIASHRVYLGDQVYLFECKQVTCKDGKGRLAFSRLKQLHDLLNFSKIKDNHRAYFVIAFYDGRWDKSEIYLVEAEYIKNLTDDFLKVSLNREDAQLQFYGKELKVEKGVIQWKL